MFIFKVQSISPSALTIIRKRLIRKSPLDELINICLVKETGATGPVSCFPANALHSSSMDKEILFLYAVTSYWKNCAHSPKRWSSARGLGSTCLQDFTEDWTEKRSLSCGFEATLTQHWVGPNKLYPESSESHINTTRSWRHWRWGGQRDCTCVYTVDVSSGKKVEKNIFFKNVA